METSVTVWDYIDQKIVSLQEDRRRVTADNYGKAGRCLRRYCPKDTLTFPEITEAFVLDFNTYLKSTRVQKATISFYNRVLRSIYNQAVKDNIVKNAHPFDNVYTKVDAKISPIRAIKSENGEMISLNDLSKEELFRRYCTVMTKYNALVNKLSLIVGV